MSELLLEVDVSVEVRLFGGRRGGGRMRGHAALSGSLSGLPARIIKASIGARNGSLAREKKVGR